MAESLYNWTWTVLDAAQNCVVELDVCVTGSYNKPLLQGAPITITNVQSVFRKHGKDVLFDIPEDLKKLCLLDLQKDEKLQNMWISSILDEEVYL